LEFKQISNDTSEEVLFETENLTAKLDRKDPRREKLRGDKRVLKKINPSKVNRGGLKRRDWAIRLVPPH